MTATVEVHARPLDPTTTRHPLAHRSGLALLCQHIDAHQRWRHCTPAQRRTLTSLHGVVQAAGVRAHQTGQPVTPPHLPDGVHPRVARGLCERGLVDGGRLTVEGVLTVWWAAGPKEGA